MPKTRRDWTTRKSRISVLAGMVVVLSLFVLVSCVVVASLRVDIIHFSVTPGLFVDLDPSSAPFVLDPDHAPSSIESRAVDVGTNASPTFFNIGLLPIATGLDFSYRMIKEGEEALAWQDIPIIPAVAAQELLGIGETPYTLDLQATAGPTLSEGSYPADLQLQFQGAGGLQIYTLHLGITVLPRSPVVDAGLDQTVNEGDLVAFSGNYDDPDVGESYTIAWDFGDGNAASGSLTPTHTYPDNGTYTVTLTVTDSGGRIGQDTLTIVVNDLGPIAHVESVPPIIPPLTIEVGEEVTFDASGSTSNPDAIVSYEWDWNYVGLVFEPSGDAGETAIHAFEEEGTYTIAVRVTDDDGSIDIAALEVEVVITPATTTEVRTAVPEVAGGGGAEAPEVAIDEMYIHHQALAVSQFHLVSPGAPEEPSTPVIYFPFDEGSGEYAYNQIDIQSGTEPVLRGALSQPDWVEGAPVHENAFALILRENGYIEIPADQRMSFSWNQDFTLELWVRATDLATERSLVQRRCLDSGALYGLDLFEGLPLFYVSAGVDNYTVVKAAKSIGDGAWHHVACIRESGTLKIYVDGVLAAALTPGTIIAGAGGGNLSSDEPTYVGGSGELAGSLGGLVDASYRIGETIEFQLRITDETGTSIPDAAPSLLFIQYDYLGQKVSSEFVGRLEYNPDEEKYTFFFDTSAYEEGIYDFFLVSDDGSQQQLRIMLLEIE